MANGAARDAMAGPERSGLPRGGAGGGAAGGVAAGGAAARVAPAAPAAPVDPHVRRDLLLLQICDSVFPIGAYAHSFGLETYVQRGIVHDALSASAYLEQQIRYPLTYTELLGMRLVYEACAAGDLARVRELEALMAAARVPAEMRRGSQRMAARFCKTVGTLLDGASAERFAAYVASAPAHLLNAAYGACAAAVGIELDELLRRFLYSQVSAMVATCVKAIPLSQTAGQEMLFATAGLQAQAVGIALAADPALLGLSTPGFDARCIEHETLYSRLYMS